MALSGIFLIFFLVVHAGINACIWVPDNGMTFNRAAHFMGSTIVIRIVEVGLFILFFIHIIQGLMLATTNSTKRGVAYAVNYGNRGSRWYSRSMGLLGTIILLFLLVHWVQFWVPSRFGEVGEMTLPNGDKVHNLFGLMYTTFKELWVVILYVLGCISLGYHLAHGFQSSFRTMGVHNRKYVRMLVGMGNVFAIVISVAFAMMPISMYLDWVKFVQA